MDILAREVDKLAQEVDKLAQFSPYWQGNGEWHGICTLLGETQLRNYANNVHYANYVKHNV